MAKLLRHEVYAIYQCDSDFHKLSNPPKGLYCMRCLGSGIMPMPTNQTIERDPDADMVCCSDYDVGPGHAQDCTGVGQQAWMEVGSDG